jgi:hypothetical protein
VEFLCLVWAQTAGARPAGADADRRCDEDGAFVDALRRSGHHLMSYRLSPPQAAVTVHVREGRLYTTEGPCAAAMGHVEDCHVIAARDLNEAILVAARIPGARRGSVEVRPVANDSRTPRALGLRDAAARAAS